MDTHTPEHTDVSKYDSIFSRCDFDAGLNVGEVMWTHYNWLWLLNQLQVTCIMQHAAQQNGHIILLQYYDYY